jgi:hypothetical protein
VGKKLSETASNQSTTSAAANPAEVVEITEEDCTEPGLKSDEKSATC